jgi:hypothetical protein
MTKALQSNEKPAVAGSLKKKALQDNKHITVPA